MARDMARKECFVLAPLGLEGSEVRRRSNDLLEYVIRPATEQTGYTVARADEISAPGLITTQIIIHTIESPLVIADLSGRNPNVLYELGIRHAVGKPVIQITTDAHDLPFDVSAMRSIIVDLSSLDSVVNAKTQLAEAILHLEENPESADSPVTAAVDLQSLNALGITRDLKTIPTDRSDPALFSTIMSVLGDLDSRMKSIEHRIERSFPIPEAKQDFSRRVFIVHGHDGELKNELARFLERLDFEPVILHEQPDHGQTIIAKLRGEMSDVGFAFVLLTPDDLGTTSSKETDL